MIETSDVAYEPYLSRRGATWRAAFNDLWRSRELAWTLLMRDLTARYRQSVLGWLWALLPGVGTTILFVYLRNQTFLQIGEPQRMPYPAYLLFMFTIWQFFAGGIVIATQSLSGAGSFIARVNFPKETIVIAALGSALFELCLRALLLIPVFAWFHVSITWTIIFIPLALFPMILLTLGLGFLFSVFNTLLRDVGNALPMLLGFFFFLVPVIYPPPKEWPQVLLSDYNPVSAILIAIHDLTVIGSLTRPQGFVIAVLFSLVIFFLGWRVFRLAQPIIAERI